MTQRLPKSVLEVVTFTIDNGQTVSGSADSQAFIDLTNYVLVGVQFPATMTGASLAVQVSNDAGVYDSYGAVGTAPSTYVTANGVTFTKQNSQLVLYSTSAYRVLEGLGKYIQFISASSEGAKRTFKAYLVPRS